MIQLNANHLFYLLEAARWTLLAAPTLAAMPQLLRAGLQAWRLHLTCAWACNTPVF